MTKCIAKTCLRRSAAALLLVVGLGLGLQACLPEPPEDDNGDLSFVRQVVPLLLGRKPKGADEVEVLADMAGVVGREAVVRLLMEQPEFVSHWTATLLDDLQLQQDGNRVQDGTCFRNPMRDPPSPDLAGHVATEPLTSNAPGGKFNMVDVIQSAIVADDLSAIYRAYPIPLGYRPDLPDYSALRPASTSDALNRSFLNHQIACFACHSSDSSVTNGVGWDRTFAIPAQLEAAVYGQEYWDVTITPNNMFGIFRTDQYAPKTSDGSGSTAENVPFIQPWGLDASCAKIKKQPFLAALPDLPTSFAGAGGSKIGMMELAQVFKSGSEALKANGLARTAVPNANPTVPSDQGYAYMIALTITENVWEDVMGEKLTIANFYPRNPDQRDTLWSLTEDTFISSGWSLKDLLARIVTTTYFNRHAPDTGSGSTAYGLAMIFNPWVAHDPRIPDPTPDPKDYHNGQGELVHRYSPRSLLYSVTAAMDWPAAERFPFKPYPPKELITASGQYISDYQQGTRGVDFQGLLGWEAQLGTCQKPAAVATDWIDRLVAAVPAFDTAHPGFPLTLADMTATTKDWLVGDGTISSVVPVPVDQTPIPSEEAALAGLYGAPLTTTAASVADLGPKLRQLCGILLESPKFMLAGIETHAALDAPRLRVCNGAPCSYAEICAVYAATLHDMGHRLVCGDHVVYAPPNLDLELEELCPYGDCIPIELDPGSIYEHIPDIGIVTFPAQPITTQPWLDSRRPTLLVARAEAARVVAARGVTIRSAGAKDFTALREGAVLQAGDMLLIPSGAEFSARSDGAAFVTPKDGMAAKSTLGQSDADRAFLEAAQGGKLETVKALLADGANVNTRDRFGETALMKAAAAGNLPLMKLLFDDGADPNARAGSTLSVADYAAVARQASALDLLARYNAFARSPEVLARLQPHVEVPWLFVVAATKAIPVREATGPMSPGDAWTLTVQGRLGTKPKDYAAVEAAFRKSNLASRGEAGPLRSAKAAAEAWQNYLTSGAFAAEHPNVPLPAAARAKP